MDTKLMGFFLIPSKVEKVRSMAKKILREIAHGRGWASTKRVASFVGLCVSLTFAVPFARFYTRSLCWDLGHRTTGRQAARHGARFRLRHQSIRDLRTCRDFMAREREGRPIHAPIPECDLHTDAADLGFGGTLGGVGEAGDPGLWWAQGVWH